VDANITDKDRLSAHSATNVHQFASSDIGIAGGPAQGNFEGSGLQNTYSVGLNYNRFFSNTLLLNFALGGGITMKRTTPISGRILQKRSAFRRQSRQDDNQRIVGITINGGFSNPLIGFSASLLDSSETNIDLRTLGPRFLAIIPSIWRRPTADSRCSTPGADVQPARSLYFQRWQTALNTGTGATVTSFGNDFASFLLDVPGQRDETWRPSSPTTDPRNSLLSYKISGWSRPILRRYWSSLGVLSPPRPLPRRLFKLRSHQQHARRECIGNNPNDLGIATHINTSHLVSD